MSVCGHIYIYEARNKTLFFFFISSFTTCGSSFENFQTQPVGFERLENSMTPHLHITLLHVSLHYNILDVIKETIESVFFSISKTVIFENVFLMISETLHWK